jgi:hypothetical protein
MIIASIGLSIAFLRADLSCGKNSKPPNEKKELALRELRITRRAP